jgi:hypothetical protein
MFPSGTQPFASAEFQPVARGKDVEEPQSMSLTLYDGTGGTLVAFTQAESTDHYFTDLITDEGTPNADFFERSDPCFGKSRT